jgi:hypothetical protein
LSIAARRALPARVPMMRVVWTARRVRLLLLGALLVAWAIVLFFSFRPEPAPTAAASPPAAAAASSAASASAAPR